MMGLDRGDIVLVDFNPARGGEIGKLRPAVIMSQSDEIEILDTIIVIPLSTMLEPNSLPYRFLIEKREDLKNDSDVCMYEIRALSKTRIKQKIATISKDEMKTIQKALCDILG